MIQKLQRKFIIIAMGSLLAVMLVVLGLINLISVYQMTDEIRVKLDMISANSGQLPSYEDIENSKHLYFTAEFPYETRYFSVVLNEEGKVLDMEMSHISSVDTLGASEYANVAISSNHPIGYIRADDNDSIAYGIFERKRLAKDKRKFWSMSYAYKVTKQEDENYLVVFLDYTREHEKVQNIMKLSAGIGLAAYFVVFVLVAVLSRRAIAPVIQSFEKQRQFVTNAGHELKTPLAIISANTEIIQMMNGDNEWTTSTLNQIKRLTLLVNNLIRLARMEENDENIVIEKVIISDLFKETTESFGSILEKDGKKLVLSIEPGLEIMTDKNLVQELISIMMDNAVKYCDENGEVRAVLSHRGKRVKLRFLNNYAAGAGADYSRFFDRFYRADQSHNSAKKGFGIGLSMAQEIVSTLKGKISVGWKDGIVMFTIIL
ncbi:hypothetical protein SAMN06296386_10877 [Lachnospiraceae bacterium]|nr:hypothetical protein SAMN06296386_10877 [Lachnospiraceae bacterium]